MNDDKESIRRAVSQKILTLAAAKRFNAERRMVIEVDIFLRQLLSENAVVMAYSPLPDEPAIAPLLDLILANHFRLCLPVMETTGKMSAREICDLSVDLQKNKRGITEPKNTCAIVEPSTIEVIIVPGRAFTKTGLRLGRGGGFYDRFLPRTPARRIAVAYRCQMVADLPCEPHDQQVHEIFYA